MSGSRLNHSDFRGGERAWLLVLLEGDERARPRSHSTLYVYFGRVRSHLLAWAPTRARLREVAEDDVSAVLHALTGHQLAGTFTSLRSLFQLISGSTDGTTLARGAGPSLRLGRT